MNSDLQLFHQIRKNSRDAFNELFLRHYKPLCYFALTFLGKVEDAEDLVSDVFVSLWMKREQLDIRQFVKAYLYTCVRHEALARLEKKLLRWESIDEAANEQAPSTDIPDELLIHEELNAAVVSIVDTLPKHCRQIFILSRFNGLRYAEIAAALNISEKTVENQLVKALTILRDKLHLRNRRSPIADNNSVTFS